MTSSVLHMVRDVCELAGWHSRVQYPACENLGLGSQDSQDSSLGLQWAPKLHRPKFHRIEFNSVHDTRKASEHGPIMQVTLAQTLD